MIETLTWCITAISITGTVLNIRKNIACFYLWTFGNAAWLTFDLWSRLYSRAMLDAVQLAFAAWGIKRLEKEKPLGVRGWRRMVMSGEFCRLHTAAG